MKRISKYIIEEYIRVPTIPIVVINAPKKSMPISVIEQKGKMVLYCEEDDQIKEKEELIIAIVETGEKFPFREEVPNRFLDTVKLEKGKFVFHIYQLIKEAKNERRKKNG